MKTVQEQGVTVQTVHTLNILSTVSTYPTSYILHTTTTHLLVVLDSGHGGALEYELLSYNYINTSSASVMT